MPRATIVRTPRSLWHGGPGGRHDVGAPATSDSGAPARFRHPSVRRCGGANRPLRSRVERCTAEVEPNRKGTSLHDVSGWFPTREFVIPAGTTYSDEILIVKDDQPKTNPKGTVSGFHYMLTARTRMAPVTFKGYLDNMAREAVAMQVRAAQTTTKK